jgi:uncharacterized membrane protein
MTLSETGEARVRGYLFVLGQSLRASLPRDLAQDAVREIESHLRERLDQLEPAPEQKEKDAVERVLLELGPPLRVAQAYSTELTVDEALASQRAVAVLRAVWRLATTTVAGFAAALGLFVGYVCGGSFLVIAMLKPVFPRNVGLFVVDGVPHSFGASFPGPPGAQVLGGYWIIPISLALGLGILVLTHRGAGRFLAWWRGRRAGFPRLVVRGA